MHHSLFVCPSTGSHSNRTSQPLSIPLRTVVATVTDHHSCSVSPSTGCCRQNNRTLQSLCASLLRLVSGSLQLPYAPPQNPYLSLPLHSSGISVSARLCPQAGVSPGRRYSARVVAAPADGYLVTALLQSPAPPCLVQLPARRGLNDLTAGPARPQIGDKLDVLVKRCGGTREETAGW